MTSLEHLVLLPQPRRILGTSGHCRNDAEVHRVRDVALPAQGYRIAIVPNRIVVESADDAGAHYAAMTLRQIRRVAPELPCGTIEDWPDFAVRGAMLDISRDKVPTMTTLFRLVDELSEWKFNHLELYTEHTFAYRAHPDVWRYADPMTAEQVRELDAYCRERFVELVPNQNSFGHMTRWLKHPPYRELAEAPEGHTAWGQWRPFPFSLNPLDPRSLELVAGLYDELLPNFASRKFNVGCDETVDLGQGRSKETCDRLGKGRVYLDYLLKVHEKVRRHGLTMHFWGDIILNHPELLAEVPRDSVALVWGYEADHPFDVQCTALEASGLPFHVCPGTSSWNALTGRTETMLRNVRAAAHHGLGHGATGLLMTDWGDNGHWQTLPFSYPGWAWAACCAWCGATQSEDRLAAQLDAHVFRDRAERAGRTILDLGRVVDCFANRRANASPVFHLLRDADLRDVLGRTTIQELQNARRANVEAVKGLARICLERDDADQIQREMALGAWMVDQACDRALRCIDRPVKAVPEPDLDRLVETMRTVWQFRNRPGGLDDSLRPLLRRMA